VQGRKFAAVTPIHNLAKVGVGGSNPLARSILINNLALDVGVAASGLPQNFRVICSADVHPRIIIADRFPLVKSTPAQGCSLIFSPQAKLACLASASAPSSAVPLRRRQSSWRHHHRPTLLHLPMLPRPTGRRHGAQLGTAIAGTFTGPISIRIPDISKRLTAAGTSVARACADAVGAGAAWAARN
jgi:hypothetical protein